MNTALRIVFMGTPDFAVSSLQTLLNGPDTLLAVVCQPDKAKGRGKKMSPPPVKVLAEQYGLPVLQPHSVRTPEFMAQLAELGPDILVVVAYGKILPLALLRLPRLGAINVHASLLPKYRGAAPVQWAVIHGEAESGVTIMQLDEGMDTGDILLTRHAAIGPMETSGELFVRLATLGAEALSEALAQIKSGQNVPTPQDHSLASVAPMLRKEQGHLDWRLPAKSLHNLIRGLDPWPSAYGFLDGKRYRFFRSEVILRDCPEPPGTICRADQGGLLVATGKNGLRIEEIQQEGKKRMPVADWLRGVQLGENPRIS